MMSHLRRSSRFGYSWMVIFVSLVLTSSAHSKADEASSVDKPNIVLFLADDLGWTGLNCFGSDLYETPRLDALANAGMKFTNAYAACTVCSPTRASLLTGMYPARLRLTDFIAGQNRPHARMKIPDWTKQLDSKRITIAETLQLAGYRTAHVGKWHLNPTGKSAGFGPTDQGFDVSIGKPRGTKGYFLKKSKSESGSNFLTDALTDQACEFIADSSKQPFFLYFAFHVPHTPIQGREDHVKYFEGKIREEMIHKNPTYAAMVKSMDESVGRVLDKLEELKLSQNTVVLFISDNGGLTQRYGKHDGFTDNLPLRRGKGSAYEGGVRVPMIVHWPEVTEPKSISTTPVMTIDFFPTLMEIAQIEIDNELEKSIDGRSLVPLFKDSNATIDRCLYWHYPHYHAGGDWPYSAIRCGNYRLIENLEDDSIQLFDLKNDLGEKVNLANSQPAIAGKLHERLKKWRISVDAQMPTKNPNFDPTKPARPIKNR